MHDESAGIHVVVHRADHANRDADSSEVGLVRPHRWEFGDAAWPEGDGVLQVYALVDLRDNPGLARLVEEVRCAMSGAPCAVVVNEYLHVTLDVVAGRVTHQVTAEQRAALTTALTTRLADQPVYLGTAGSALAYGAGVMLDISPAEPLTRLQKLVRAEIAAVFGEDACTWRQSKPHIGTHYARADSESDPWQRRLRRIDPNHMPLRIHHVALVDVRPDLTSNELRFSVLGTRIPFGIPLPAHRAAAAAKIEFRAAEQDLERYLDEMSTMGDRMDAGDAATLAAWRRARDEARARWHACAPTSATAWWPGGWRAVRFTGEINYLQPVGGRPWPARAAAQAGIRAANTDTDRQRMPCATPVWIPVDHSSAGPIALDVDYWSTLDKTTT